MPLTVTDVFPPDALDANRRGALSDAQARGLGNLARYRRKSQLQFAGLALFFAVLIGGFASSSASIVSRVLVTLACLVIAAFLAWRAMAGGDALTRDLRDGRVVSADGAVGKSRTYSGGNATTYFLDVGDARFSIARNTYEFAPDAGYVRAYYLPRSRKVVNLERLPNPAFEHATPGDVIRDATSATVLGKLATSFSFDTRKRNEARADIAAVGDVMKSAFDANPTPPQGARDPRPLGEAIVGTWSNGLMTVAFAPDGQVVAHVMGRKERGHWSVDGSGRLCADVMGQAQAADAWVAGDQLTISAEGQGFTFTRQP